MSCGCSGGKRAAKPILAAPSFDNVLPEPCTCATGAQIIGAEGYYRPRGENRFALSQQRPLYEHGGLYVPPVTFFLSTVGLSAEEQFGELIGEFTGLSLEPYSPVSSVYIVEPDGRRNWLDVAHPIRRPMKGPLKVLATDGGPAAMLEKNLGSASAGLIRWDQPEVAIMGHYSTLPDVGMTRQSTLLTRYETAGEVATSAPDSTFYIDGRGRRAIRWSILNADITSLTVLLYGLQMRERISGTLGAFLLDSTAYTAADNGVPKQKAVEESYPAYALKVVGSVAGDTLVEVEAL